MKNHLEWWPIDDLRLTIEKSSVSNRQSSIVNCMKPPALLIPGLDGTGKLFYRQIDRLSEYYRVVAWNFLPRAFFQISDLVQELAQYTGGEQAGSMLVVGESFGGVVAMHFALSYPERLNRLGLVNTFPVYRRRIRIRLALRLIDLFNRPKLRAVKERVVDHMLASEGILAEDRLMYKEAVKLVHYPAYRRRLEIIRRVDLRNRLQEISVPTLLFASGKDKLVPSVSEARYMAARIPGSTLYEFPHAGHALLLTPGFSLADYFKG
jgi:pimeloyl-ACP methyl ester carboxylesterase